MSVAISGILLDPYGNPAPFAEVKFITWQGALDVLTTSSAVYKTSSDGVYSFAVEFGTFTVQVRYNQSNGKFETIKKKVIVNSGTTATTLGELLLFNEPLTPPEIEYVKQLVAEAEGYRNETLTYRNETEVFRDEAGVSASEAEQSAIDAANSAAAIVGVPLNGGVWAAGQTFTAYNQYMIYNGIPYAPLTSTPLPYGPVGATPDFNFVGPYPLNDHSELSNLNPADGSAHNASDIGMNNGKTVEETVSTKLDDYPSGNLVGDATNFDSSKNDTELLKNRAGSNQDTWVMLFGDSHGWGQGAPESDRFQLSSNWSRWSAAQFNQGFMERIAESIKSRKKWCVNKYGAGMSVAQKFLHAENNIKVNTGDPEASFPLVCVGGNIESRLGDFAPTANTPLNWYAPQVVGDTYSNLNYREKVSTGIFGNQYLRLKRCGALDMPTNGKVIFWEITPNYNAVTYGAGITDLTQNNGGDATPLIFGGRNTTTNTVYINSGSPVPDWIKVAAKVYIAGIGYAKVNVLGATNSGVGFTKVDGTPWGTSLAKQVHLGMKVYPEIYGTGLLMLEMQNAARVSYIGVKRQSTGGKIRVAFSNNMNGGFLSLPAVDNNGTFRNSANSWAWKLASGTPSIQRVNNDGTISTVSEATSDAFGCVIDTENTATEDVVYRIDWGSRQQGRMFIYLDNTTVNDYVDIRGVMFDNNKVANYSMGAHTVGAWIGTQDTTSGDGIRDRVADILNYAPVRPSYVITQIPFVNEYLQQTPIAAFKANLQLFVDKFNNHLSGTNNYNIVGTDFMFFTSLRNREIAFEGAAESAITYDMYVQAALEFCQDNNHAFVDCEKELFRLVSDGRVDYQRLFNDSNHPSDYANEVIARVLEQDYLQFIS